MADHIKHNRREPRSFWSLFVRLGGWAAIGAVVILLALTLVSHFTERAAGEFDARGVITDGRVVDRTVRVSRDSDGDTTRSYYLKLEFETLSGERRQKTEKVSRKFFDDAQRGDLVELRYLPDQPWRVEVPVGENRTAGRWTLGLAGLVGVAALWFFNRFGGQAARAIRARRHGAELLAEVTGVRELSVEVNDVKQGRLQWRDEDGLEGESLMRGLPELHRYDKGDIITVYRMGDDVWWMGDVGPRKER